MTSQYGAYALHAGLARLHALIRMLTPTRPCTNMHARTQRSISNTYGFSTATMTREPPQRYVIRTLSDLFLVG